MDVSMLDLSAVNEDTNGENCYETSICETCVTTVN